MISLKATRLREKSLVLGLLVMLAFSLAATLADAQGDDLFSAAENGDVARVKALLATGTEVDAELRDGATALTLAPQNCHPDVVQGLLGKGAQVNAKDNKGMTVLLLASQQGHLV